MKEYIIKTNISKDTAFLNQGFTSNYCIILHAISPVVDLGEGPPTVACRGHIVIYILFFQTRHREFKPDSREL